MKDLFNKPVYDDIYMKVGSIYLFCGGESTGRHSHKQEMKNSGLYEFEGAKMKYLGKYPCGHLFQSVRHPNNKAVFSDIELREHRVTEIE